MTIKIEGPRKDFFGRTEIAASEKQGCLWPDIQKALTLFKQREGFHIDIWDGEGGREYDIKQGDWVDFAAGKFRLTCRNMESGEITDEVKTYDEIVDLMSKQYMRGWKR